MAFQKRGGGKRPDMSIALSVKQGEKYVKGPSFGLWSNDQGGPSFRGTLKDQYLAQIIEFMGNAQEAGLAVSLAVFENGKEEAPKKAFGNKVASFGARPNPFKKSE